MTAGNGVLGSGEDLIENVLGAAVLGLGVLRVSVVAHTVVRRILLNVSSIC